MANTAALDGAVRHLLRWSKMMNCKTYIGMNAIGAEWSWWELTQHEIEIPAGS